MTQPPCAHCTSRATSAIVIVDPGAAPYRLELCGPCFEKLKAEIVLAFAEAQARHHGASGTA